MNKTIRIIIICGCFLCLVACNKKINQDDNIKRYYLSNEYYGNGNFINVSSEEVNNIKDKNYVLFTYNNYCNMAKPCEDIFKDFIKKYKIDFLSIPFEEFKDTVLYKEVSYAPSIIIVVDNKVLANLDAESDEDLNKYQDLNEFEKWMNNFIYFSKK